MKKQRLISYFLLAFLISAQVNAETLPPLPKGPMILTSANSAMQHAHYWIDRLPNPDKVLKTPAQLAAFNEDVPHIVPDRMNIFKLGLYKAGVHIKSQLDLEFKTLRNRKLFRADDQVVAKDLFDKTIKPLMNIESVPRSVKIKWGTAIRAASVRALPSDVKMLEQKGDVEFDQLQFTLIKLWTPVAIYHTSKDGNWVYLQAPYSRGWVKSKDIAVFSNQNELAKYVKSKQFLSVTGESIPVYKDVALKALHDRPSMGTVLPLKGTGSKVFEIWMPFRGKGGNVYLKVMYINRKSDVSIGFLPFTQRNIIKQAFKLLGQRYGWGGMYNGRDCSGFTHDVFLSLGVEMPRDSKSQGFVGTQINHFAPFDNDAEKKAALRSARPGITLLRMPKHLMLYLGEVGGEHYVIHSTWAERISQTSDEKRRINQVVVSDLSLNGNSHLGSLYDRLISINELD